MNRKAALVIGFTLAMRLEQKFIDPIYNSLISRFNRIVSIYALIYLIEFLFYHVESSRVLYCVSSTNTNEHFNFFDERERTRKAKTVFVETYSKLAIF